MGFKTLCKAFDCCLMYKREPPGADGKQRVVFCIIHVDDMMWADTTGSSMIKGAVKELEEHYKGKVKHNVIDIKIKDEKTGYYGYHNVFGWDAKGNATGGWSIAMGTYIKKLLKKNNMTGVRMEGRSRGRQFPNKGPLFRSKHEASCPSELRELTEEFGFKFDSVVGAMIHLLQVRFDLQGGIRGLARFTKNPGRKVFEYIRHFAAYIKATQWGWLNFNGKKELVENHNMMHKVNRIAGATNEEYRAKAAIVVTASADPYTNITKASGRQAGSDNQDTVDMKPIMETFAEMNVGGGRKYTQREVQAAAEALQEKRRRKRERAIEKDEHGPYAMVQQKAKLEGFADAEMGSNDGKRSIYCTAVCALGVTGLTKIKIMATVDKLIMGPEAQGMSEGADEAEYVSAFYSAVHQEMFDGDSPFEPGVMAMYCDNMSVVQAIMKTNREYITVNAPSHIKLKLSDLSDKVQNGRAVLYHIGTNWNFTDHGTKWNEGEKVRLHSILIMNGQKGEWPRLGRKERQP